MPEKPYEKSEELAYSIQSFLNGPEKKEGGLGFFIVVVEDGTGITGLSNMEPSKVVKALNEMLKQIKSREESN